MVLLGNWKKTKAKLKISRYKALFIAAGFLAGFALYFKSLGFYFFQDDWFVLNTVKDKNLLNVLSLFEPRMDIIYYRPFSMQIFYFFFYKLFSLNPFPFHVFSFALYFTNAVLLFKLVVKLFSNKIAAYIASSLFLTASFHYMTLSWLVLTWNYFSLLFLQLALSNYVSRRIKNAFILFILALLSSEFAIVFPVFLIAVEVVFFKKTFKKLVKGFNVVAPYILVVFLYLTLRLLLYKIPATGDYQVSFGSNILTSYLWYFLWLFNIPEVFKYHFNLTGFKFSDDPTFTVRHTIAPIFFLFTTQIACAIFLAIKFFKTKYLKSVVLAFALFAISLSPVVILPKHAYPYYLTISSLPILMLLAILLSKSFTVQSTLVKLISALFIANWYLLSLFSTYVNQKTHWIEGEQVVSKKIVSAAQKNFPYPQSNSRFNIFPSSNQTSLALMDQLALKVVYNKEVSTIFLKDLSDYIEQDDSYLVDWEK